MIPSVFALLRGAVDYAGTFPPATLSLGDAVRNYARCRAGTHAWMLGSLVVSAARLNELRLEPTDSPWPVSVVIPRGAEADVSGILRLSEGWGGRAAVAAIEFPPVDIAQIADLAARVPRDVDAFFEIPTHASQAADDKSVLEQLDAVAAAGALAKIRTGGTTAAAFPAAATVYRFLRACADRTLACKATAGLHHALSGQYSLTYETGSASTRMFGFLNIAVLAAIVHCGASECEALKAVSDNEGFRFEPDALLWGPYRIPASSLAVMRRTLFRSFGSCSFAEPVDDLVRLGLA
jgi:hypothetical protein